MKLFTSILTALLITINVNAQFFSKKIKGNGDIKTETRSVSDYDKIGVSGSFDVKLFKGKEGSITVKADENLMEHIIVEVKKGALKIKPKKGYNIRPSQTIKITIPFENINVISLAGSGDVYSSDVIDSSDLKLSIAGSGDFDLNVSTKSLQSSIAGSGDINLRGDSGEFNGSIAGSGNINAYDLRSLVARIKIAGSGNVKINAVNEIHAKTAGSGDIYYTGDPKVEKISSAGSGSIKNKS